MESNEILKLKDLYDEKMFWKIYSVGGRSGHQEQRRKDYSVLSVVGSIFKDERMDELTLKDDSEFWKYFLYQATLYFIIIQITNFVFLITIAIILFREQQESLTSLAVSMGTNLLFIDVVVWGVLSVVTITTLIIIRYCKDFLSNIIDQNGLRSVHEIWKKLGYFILLLRVLLLVGNIVLQDNLGDRNCQIRGKG
jgi:hypothetical protein